MEKFAIFPHHLENALRFPHFPQHNDDIWVDFLVFFTPTGFAVSPLFKGDDRNNIIVDDRKVSIYFVLTDDNRNEII